MQRGFSPLQKGKKIPLQWNTVHITWAHNAEGLVDPKLLAKNFGF
jgi:hypothetical protein